MKSIVASVGTDHHPFDRLVRWMDDVADTRDDVDVFVQHGRTGPPVVAGGASLLPLEDLRDRFATADVVVCHGGPATIMDAIDAGHRPLVVPRDPSRGEHVDDHQQRFARRLARDGRIWLCEERTELDERLSLLLNGDPRKLTRSSHIERGTSIARFGQLVAQLEPQRRPGQKRH